MSRQGEVRQPRTKLASEAHKLRSARYNEVLGKTAELQRYTWDRDRPPYGPGVEKVLCVQGGIMLPALFAETQIEAFRRSNYTDGIVRRRYVDHDSRQFAQIAQNAKTNAPIGSRCESARDAPS